MFIYYLHCYICANIANKAMMERAAAFYLSTQERGSVFEDCFYKQTYILESVAKISEFVSSNILITNYWVREL